MARFSDECPIVTRLLAGQREVYEKGWNNGLFLQVAQGLSGQMMDVVRGTKAGLTDERIDEILHKEVNRWGNEGHPDGEAEYLKAHQEIAKAVHDCEFLIQAGKCALFSQTK